MKKTWILVAGLMCSQWGLSQSDLELAEFYYNEGSYAQAKLYLDQIWKRTKTKKVFDMYYATLLAMDDFEAAEKLVKSRMRNKNTRATAYVELGQLYVHFGRELEAKEAFGPYRMLAVDFKRGRLRVEWGMILPAVRRLRIGVLTTIEYCDSLIAMLNSKPIHSDEAVWLFDI